MTDLMYFGYEWESDSYPLQEEFIKEVKENFHDVKLEDAYDSIKGLRQSVYVDKEKEEDYFVWLFCHGWYNCSFALGVAKQEEIDRYVKKGRERYPECVKS